MKKLGSIFFLILGAFFLLPLLVILRNVTPESVIGFVQHEIYGGKLISSLCLSGVITVLNVVLSVMAGFAFARFSFPGKRAIFFALIVLMLLPTQVTLVPLYTIMQRLGFLNRWVSLVLCQVFQPFGTVLLSYAFRSIPKDVLDSARLDGAANRRLLWSVAVPYCGYSVAALGLLTFLDVWNMVEQPMVLLQDTSRYPLSVFLCVVNETNTALSFSGCVWSALPILLIFLVLRNKLNRSPDL